MSTPLFVRTVSLKARLTLALVLAFLLIFADYRLGAIEPVRAGLNSLVSPIQYLAVVPEQTVLGLAQRLRSYNALRTENEELQEQMLVMQGQMQQYQLLAQENADLRQLLATEVRAEGERMVAEVIAVDSDPFAHQVVVNKGTQHGVYVGQPVIDSTGVVGQVISVGLGTARVILISDSSHAIPTRAAGSGIRVVAQGRGDTETLELMHVPHSSGLEEGDLLLSSGLGGVFPEGFPVAEVSHIERDESLPFAQVEARPVAQLDRIRMVLLLWDDEQMEQPVHIPATGDASDD